MPKDVNNRSSRKSRAPHYHPYSNQANGVAQDSSSKEVDDSISSKEWEDATCPICMEFPHNAVLLLCTSHENGCRPYMCDTSYRHSNCLDQYRKLSGRGQCSSRDEVIHEPLSAGGSSARTRERSAVRMRPLRELLLMGDNRRGADTEHAPGRAVRGLPALGVDESITEVGVQAASEVSEQEHQQHQQQQQQQQQQQEALERIVAMESRSCSGESLDLLCPLCRGKVVGWKVVEQARRHLNCKTRNCAQESCGFTGSYDELRKHARCVHPFARPSDVDPARQRDWRHLERERDIGDVLSTIQSAMPGARILGDYVIDEENDDQEDEGDDNDFPGDDGNWWTVFLLFQVFGPVASGAGAGGSSIPTRLRGLSRGHHLSRAASASLPPRQALWGEEIQLNQMDDGGSPGRELINTTNTNTNTNTNINNNNNNNSTAAEGGNETGPSTRRRRSRQQQQ